MPTGQQGRAPGRRAVAAAGPAPVAPVGQLAASAPSEEKTRPTLIWPLVSAVLVCGATASSELN